MIEGIITEDGVPAINVEVARQAWAAIIDTGFNGELELPERLRSHVNAKFVGLPSPDLLHSCSIAGA